MADLDALQLRYLRAALQLMPPGLWTRRPDSHTGKLLNALQRTNARFAEHLENWRTQFIPSDADDMLPEWEKLLGIPDGCFPIGATVGERQQNTSLRFEQTKDQSEPSYKDIATSLGYDIGISSYPLFRAGTSRAGQRVYDEHQKFAKRITTESGANDALLQCVLSSRAHIYGRLDYRIWDATPVAALTNLRAHFVHGEFVTHDFVGVDVIDSWTNRASGDDWERGAIADVLAAYVDEVDGWESCKTGSIAGLWARTMPASDTLIKHKDFTLFIVLRVDVRSGNVPVLVSSGSEFNLRMNDHVSGADQFYLGYGGSAISRQAGLGSFCVLTIASDASNKHLRVNEDTPTSLPVSGTPADEELTLGNGVIGNFAEIIASDYVGVPGSSATVDAVTDYLMNKYEIV